MNKGRVLVTGGAGYLGGVLVPLLLESGYAVRVVDRFFYGTESLDAVKGRCELIEADTRWCPESVFADAYAIIDLAALANDPLGELDPQRTLDINAHARIRTATLAKKQGVSRYILASSCSVYGFQDDLIDESATPSPLTTYAASNVLAEEGVCALQDDHFTVTALRQGTLYGLAPRMRFDIVVNAMALALERDGVITVRGGEQWRPLLHVADSAAAFLLALSAPREVLGGTVFNVGGHNLSIRSVAQHVLSAGGKGKIVNDVTDRDTRSYRVRTEKIHQALGFTPTHTPDDGAREVLAALREGKLAFDAKTCTVDWYKGLLQKDPGILDRPFISAKFL